jgi:hypothetical protein
MLSGLIGGSMANQYAIIRMGGLPDVADTEQLANRVTLTIA